MLYYLYFLLPSFITFIASFFFFFFQTILNNLWKIWNNNDIFKKSIHSSQCLIFKLPIAIVLERYNPHQPFHESYILHLNKNVIEYSLKAFKHWGTETLNWSMIFLSCLFLLLGKCYSVRELLTLSRKPKITCLPHWSNINFILHQIASVSAQSGELSNEDVFILLVIGLIIPDTESFFFLF